MIVWWLDLQLSMQSVAYHHLSCEFEPRSWRDVSIQQYVIKSVSDLRHVSGFLRVFRFPPPIKLTAMK